MDFDDGRAVRPQSVRIVVTCCVSFRLLRHRFLFSLRLDDDATASSAATMYDCTCVHCTSVRLYLEFHTNLCNKPVPVPVLFRFSVRMFDVCMVLRK
jgi:hypothetical protein